MFVLLLILWGKHIGLLENWVLYFCFLWYVSKDDLNLVERVKWKKYSETQKERWRFTRECLKVTHDYFPRLVDFKNVVEWIEHMF